MGLGHLLVVDAGPVPVEQRYWEGDHVPSSKDIWDVGLHVLVGQRAISAVMRGKGRHVTWDAQLALTRSTRMAPLSSLAMEVPFRNAELGIDPVGRGAGMRTKFGPTVPVPAWNRALGAVSCAWAGAEPVQGQ